MWLAGRRPARQINDALKDRTRPVDDEMKAAGNVTKTVDRCRAYLPASAVAIAPAFGALPKCRRRLLHLMPYFSFPSPYFTTLYATKA